MSEWRTIDSAPRDGTKIIVWSGDYTPYVYWDDDFDEGAWVSTYFSWTGNPTHWMPLPEPPND